MIPLSAYVALSAILFMTGLVGVLIRRNFIVVLMSVEIMLNAANINLVAFSHYLHSMSGQMAALFIIAVAAAEAAAELPEENDRSWRRKVLIVEDVITRGGRAQEAIDIVRNLNGQVTGLALIADRSAGNAVFEAPVISLAEFNFPTYDPENLPEELAAIKPVKPGS